MESQPFLIVGLGNPGKEYSRTRHNLGFMVVDLLAEKYRLEFAKGKGPYYFTKLQIGGATVILVKPLTFMNLSGRAVAAALRDFDIEALEKLLVICDDIDLPFGTIRLRRRGSDGGQKGLRSIIETLGTREFCRLRIGIGDHFRDAAEYVLSPFSKTEEKELPFILQFAVDAVISFVEKGIEWTMSRFNKNVLEN